MSTARSVLVVTGNMSLGELIQRSLEETGLYKVMVVDSNQEALLCVQTVGFSIAILDCDSPGGDVISLASSMQLMLPRMQLLIICTDDNPIYPAAASFQSSALLKKPVQIPELLEHVSKATQTPLGASRPAPTRLRRSIENVSTTPPAPEWLQDVNWAARHLTSLSLETSAEAALIMRDSALWAYAGKLSQTAINELVECLVSFWDSRQHSTVKTALTRNHLDDMVRFIRLDATRGEYMLYATSLGKGMVLSLAFETDTPFSTIRAQASYLAKALAAPPGSLPPSYSKNSAAANQRSAENNAVPYVRAANLPLLLQDVPPPSPHIAEMTPTGQKNTPSWFQEASAPASLTEIPPKQKSRAQITPSVRSAMRGTKYQKPDASQQDSVSEHTTVPGTPYIDPLAPNSARSSAPNIKHQLGNGKPIMAPVLLPASPTLHYLTYSCTLIPRLPQHKLMGDLFQLLQEWMPQLFPAFGWQLLHSNLFPEYLLVIARVAPNTSPGSFVRIIRQQTSRRIFADFPRIAQENPSRDFWAPGYLILSNSQPPPEHVIRHFIEQTRLQQGFPKAR